MTRGTDRLRWLTFFCPKLRKNIEQSSSCDAAALKIWLPASLSAGSGIKPVYVLVLLVRSRRVASWLSQNSDTINRKSTEASLSFLQLRPAASCQYAAMTFPIRLSLYVLQWSVARPCSETFHRGFLRTATMSF
ncbi:hypothetical protein TRVL_07067 [Trypanosoma vivax]|nr:hypothetical protein TRVL_07067 [Trypanosoma vivax]